MIPSKYMAEPIDKLWSDEFLMKILADDDLADNVIARHAVKMARIHADLMRREMDKTCSSATDEISKCL